MIYVTHDQVEAMTLADKIVLLNAGQAVLDDGSVAQVGPPLELYHHPTNTFVAGFIGSPKMNFLPGELVAAEGNTARVTLANGSSLSASVDAGGAQPGEKVTLGIRPEHLTIGDSGNGTTQGQVMYVEHLGEASYVYLEVEGAENHVVVREQGDTAAKMGDNLSLSLPAENCHLFNSANRAYKRVISAAAETAPVV
jgi:multiple sugar transport system ATP-binding protein